MVRYILDSSAILRYSDGEAGSDPVAEIIKDHVAGTRFLISFKSPLSL